VFFSEHSVNAVATAAAATTAVLDAAPK